jgi:hypothetical protein
LKSVERVYRNGKVELMEPLAGAEGSRVIATLVQPVKPVDLRVLGLCGADTRVWGVETRLDALRWLHAQARDESRCGSLKAAHVLIPEVSAYGVAHNQTDPLPTFASEE